MQKVILTMESNRNAYLLLRLLKQFDFVHSIEFEKPTLINHEEQEIFNNDWADDFYLDDLQMTIKEFRLQTLKDEQENGMSKSEFLKEMKEWRASIEK